MLEKKKQSQGGGTSATDSGSDPISPGYTENPLGNVRLNGVSPTIYQARVSPLNHGTLKVFQLMICANSSKMVSVSLHT